MHFIILHGTYLQMWGTRFFKGGPDFSENFGPRGTNFVKMFGPWGPFYGGTNFCVTGHNSKMEKIVYDHYV